MYTDSPALANDLKLVLQTIPLPVNAGPDGLLPLGWTLAMLDRAGAVLPAGYFKQSVQLVHIASVVIQATPQVGELVTFRARLLEASPRSARVEVQVAKASLGQVTYEIVMHSFLEYRPYLNELPTRT